MLGCLGPSTFYCPKPVLHVGACEVSPWVLSVKCAAWRVQSVAGYFLRGVFLGVCSLLWVHAALLVPRAPLCPSCRRAAEPCWAGAKAPAALPCCSAVKCAALVRRCLEEKELVLTPKLSLAFLAELCWIEAGLESGSGARLQCEWHRCAAPLPAKQRAPCCASTAPPECSACRGCWPVPLGWEGQELSPQSETGQGCAGWVQPLPRGSCGHGPGQGCSLTAALGCCA